VQEPLQQFRPVPRTDRRQVVVISDVAGIQAPTTAISAGGARHRAQRYLTEASGTRRRKDLPCRQTRDTKMAGSMSSGSNTPARIQQNTM
jgi:hypothetical protein